jgi:hypothetical protein
LVKTPEEGGPIQRFSRFIDVEFLVVGGLETCF